MASSGRTHFPEDTPSPGPGERAHLSCSLTSTCGCLLLFCSKAKCPLSPAQLWPTHWRPQSPWTRRPRPSPPLTCLFAPLGIPCLGVSLGRFSVLCEVGQDAAVLGPNQLFLTLCHPLGIPNL